jgi:hypothetical protein
MSETVRSSSWVLSALALSVAFAGACAATNPRVFGSDSSSGAGGATTAHVSSAGVGGATPSSTGMGGNFVLPDAAPCDPKCSSDFHNVTDCNGVPIQVCMGDQACDATTLTCANACQAAVNNKQSVGCEYYATAMDQYSADLCFAAFVANTWNTPAHINVDFAGASLSVATFARIPSGAGPMLTYGPFDPVAGLMPGEVVILFLAGTTGAVQVPCPAPTAMMTGAAQILQASGIGNSFHITSDVPVVSYEINPYGGGSAAVTGASLLLPTSAWDTNYVAVTVTPFDIFPPSMNIIAAQDATTVTMLPKVSVAGGGALPTGPANVQYTFQLNKGQMAQFTQMADLTGSIIQSNKPIGFMAGQPCMRAPFGVAYCDHGEQMVPPVKALGNEYVGVMYRPRVPGDQGIWHMVGALDGTVLTWSSNVGGPATLNAGQTADFISDQPFVVQSQDDKHPFMLFTYMSGSTWPQLSNTSGYGDADFVISVPPQQYMSDYVFFTDPTYPETNLVIVRRQNAMMTFDDVKLDCAGTLTGWQPIGNYEWTRIDLISHDFQGQNGCTTGRHEIKSASPFGLWVWGWGTPETATFTQNVSYGYPGGMNVQPINQVIIPPTPK